MDDRGPLRVVLPMISFVPGGMGGSETYARALVRTLSDLPEVELTTLVSRVGSGEFPASTERVVRPVRGGARTIDRVRTLVEGQVPWAAARRAFRAADVVHYPFAVPVPRTRRPWLQTLLDVQHLDLPELFSTSERAYRAVAYDRPARRARRVVTISEFSKSRIVDRLGIDPDRVVVAPLGVDTAGFTPYDGPRQPIVFYPATAWPHKNHQRLLEAMAIVRSRRPEITLVLTGGRRAELGSLPDWVEHRGFVTEEEVRTLYRAASCTVYPSLYEGFGLPPLEAMASGCPVAAATSGSLREVCGDAAQLFDADDVPGMAHAIERAIDSTSQEIEHALEHVRQFTWERCARIHVDAYRSVARP